MKLDSRKMLLPLEQGYILKLRMGSIFPCLKTCPPQLLLPKQYAFTFKQTGDSRGAGKRKPTKAGSLVKEIIQAKGLDWNEANKDGMKSKQRESGKDPWRTYQLGKQWGKKYGIDRTAKLVKQKTTRSQLAISGHGARKKTDCHLVDG